MLFNKEGEFNIFNIKGRKEGRIGMNEGRKEV